LGECCKYHGLYGVFEMTIMGMKKDPNAPSYFMKRIALKLKGKKMRRIGHTKRGREQRIFDNYVRPLIIQETSEATGIDVEILNGYECDHIAGRNASGFEPLGAMFSPLNLQMLNGAFHRLKTNALTGEAQRMDWRDTATQERMVNLTARIIAKIGEVHNLNDIKNAFKNELYDKRK
jgi:hypothetical protein